MKYSEIGHRLEHAFFPAHCTLLIEAPRELWGLLLKALCITFQKKETTYKIIFDSEIEIVISPLHIE